MVQPLLYRNLLRLSSVESKAHVDRLCQAYFILDKKWILLYATYCSGHYIGLSEAISPWHGHSSKKSLEVLTRYVPALIVIEVHDRERSSFFLSL